MDPRNVGSKRFSVASPSGTLASSGQAATSSGSLELKIGRTSVPLLLPAVLLKNAPAVSPAKPFTLRSPGSTMPARLMPDPKTYWSAVPRGQIPPPTVDELVTQIPPSEKIWHCTRLVVKIWTAPAKSRNPPGRPGLPGLATPRTRR